MKKAAQNLTSDQKITVQTAKKLGLSEKEYQKILALLGRVPNITELGMFSIMWSEHCSYKSSRRVLKYFPTKGEAVLIGPGQGDAGVVDIGDGLVCVFKIESHNHPSAIEPFQGAATGVGGILRDIFTMGARPIALLDSLRFGSLKNNRVKYLFNGIVGGIAHYGNCIGVPTVGGEIYFDPTYEGNPLVNVLCVGVGKKNEITLAKTKGIGNPVIYVGALTGRDGLGGASFASRDLTKDSEEDRPAVQVGDPFKEKLLLEACLELNKKGLILGLKDMGAAGLTCSNCEMASSGNTGIDIDLARVPLRSAGMTPFEIMLSESQERMLLVVQKGREKDALKILKKWDLEAVVIGKVTADGILRVRQNKKIVAQMPARALTDEAPPYRPSEKKPAYLKKVNDLNYKKLPLPKNFNKILKLILSHPTIASKKMVYEQYDHMVRTNTILPPGADAAVLRIKETNKALAVTTDANSTYSYLNPYLGGQMAVAEASRNLACVGAAPIGVTDCLNFGNPQKPEIFWQFEQSVRGMSQALKKFGISVVSGNVSFYNENPKGAIEPTPVVGMVGLVEADKVISPWFKNEEDLIVLIGPVKEELGGSLYLNLVHQKKKGPLPPFSLNQELKTQKICREAISQGLLASAHDASEGGLAISLAEACFHPEKPKGAEIDLEKLIPRKSFRNDSVLFGENQSRIVVSLPERNYPDFEKIVKKFRGQAVVIGKVSGKNLVIKKGRKILIDARILNLKKIWAEGLAKNF